MAWIVEVSGPGSISGSGMTPDELYGEGTWGPAIFGVLNDSGLSDAEASTFADQPSARSLSLSLHALAHGTGQSLQFRVREVP